MFNFFRSDLFLKSNIKRFILKYAHHDNWHNFDIKKGDLGYGWIHYGIIRVQKPKKILCIGSRYGFVPAICALACKDNRKGEVDFVDAGFDQADSSNPNHWGGIGLWKKINKDKYFKVFGINSRLKLHVLTTKEFIQKKPNDFWDYIHIDGDHSYEGVKYDFETFWPHLKEGGFIAFHDIHTPDEDGNHYGVSRLWQEMKKTKKYNMTELFGKYGLGLIQKN